MTKRTFLHLALAALLGLGATAAANAYEVRHDHSCNGVSWYSNPTFRLSNTPSISR